MSDLDRALRHMRHLYMQMLDGHVKDTASAARGLLGPAIELVEDAATPPSRYVKSATDLSADEREALEWLIDWVKVNTMPGVRPREIKTRALSALTRLLNGGPDVG